MYFKINFGELMDWRPGADDGAGDEPVLPPGLPGDEPAAAAPGSAASDSESGPGSRESRDPSGPAADADAVLADFGPGGVWDSRPPSASLAAAIGQAAGEGWRCEGGTHEQIVGVAKAVAAVESLLSAAKLGVLRAAIREDDDGLSPDRHGDLPDEWSRSLTHDVALALAMSPISAGKLLQTAWDLEVFLPGVGALLEDGTLTYPKARAINNALELLSEKDKAKAEALILPVVAGKTYTQVEKIAMAAAAAVDPGLAERSREHAERNRARVTLRREASGAATLSGEDLPTAETLAAHATICARAQQYKDSGAFPEVLTDQLRAMAYLDLMNGVSADARIAAGQPDSGLGARAEGTFREDPDHDDPGPAATPACGGSDCPCDACDGRCAPNDDNFGPEDPDGGDSDDGPDGFWPGDGRYDGHGGPEGGPDDGGADGEPDGLYPDDEPGDGEPGGSGPSDGLGGDAGPDGESGGDGSGGAGSGGGLPGGNPLTPPPPTAPPPSQPPQPGTSRPWSMPPETPAPPRLTDLTIPLATLLGPPRRPGEAHGFGTLDPALCRALAALAAASPHSTVCVTVTEEHGYAIGHGCLRSGRRKARLPGAPEPPLTALPARLNLTITATRLTELLHDVTPPGQRGRSRLASPTGWGLAPPSAGQKPPPDEPPWCGTWAVTLPSGLQYDVALEPVPTHACDHRNESHAYEPNDTLRHLVQVRDYECTFPTCSRHARESDFEHAVPYDQGGRTCGCNSGARSRACHQVKQSPGWTVTQPQPGWHRWTTPSGRTYTQEPHRYPT